MIAKKDNQGNVLSSEQLEYFKDSKVVDKNNQLVVCYHGSPNDFNEFKKDLIGTNNHALPNVGLFGKGFYFSNEQYNASKYGDTKAYYVNIKNPFMWKDYNTKEKIEQLIKEFGDNIEYRYDYYFDEYRMSYLDTIEKQTKFAEFLKSKGYDGVIYTSLEHFDKEWEVVAFEPNQIKLITNTNPTTSNKTNEDLKIDYDRITIGTELTEEYLIEVRRNDLIAKSKRGKEYKDKSKGKNRWERKKWSRVASSTKDYNSIDMNTFFKKDILVVNIPIRGETDNYIVRVKFGGALQEIQRMVQKNNNVLDYKSISQALVNTFNSDNVYVWCNCLDWTYRMNYWSEKNNFSAAKPREQAPYENQFEWTNKYDNMGGICKHVALVISNLFWMMKVASVINNYIHYAEMYMQRQFAEIIFPKIYGMKYPDAIQLGLFDRKYLKHSKGVIDEINAYGKSRTKFKKKPKDDTEQEVEIKTHPKQLSIFDKEVQEQNPPFKKQSIFDMGVEDVEEQPKSSKPTFKQARKTQPIINQGYKQISLFDEEEEEESD